VTHRALTINKTSRYDGELANTREIRERVCCCDEEEGGGHTPQINPKAAKPQAPHARHQAGFPGKMN